MACVDDDVQPTQSRKPSFSFSIIPMAAPPRGISIQETPQETFVRELSQGRTQIKHHYIPYHYTEWHPIGCTDSHAFAVLQNDSAYSIVSIRLMNSMLQRPSQTLSSSSAFTSPWLRHAETFTNYLGGCAHKNRLCVITTRKIVVFDSAMKTLLNDATVSLSALTACSMNHSYLVVVGVEVTKTTQSLFIYKLDVHPPVKVIQYTNFKHVLRDVQMLSSIQNAMLMQYDKRKTLKASIKCDDARRYYISKVGEISQDIDTFPTLSKELSETRRILQIYDKQVVALEPGRVVRMTAPADRAIVDASDFQHGVMITHDAANTIRFYDQSMKFVTMIPWESLVAPTFYYDKKIPSIAHPYNSLSVCQDDKNIIAILASTGELITVTVV